MEQWFGIVEAVFVFGLALGFYVWQSRSLKRDVAAREERERLERERGGASPDD